VSIKKSFLLLIWMVICPLAVFSQSNKLNKLTPRVKALLNSEDRLSVHKYWIYLNDSAFDSSKIFLTSKAKQRRAKVDADNFLIDAYDYPLRDSILNAIESTGVSIRHVIHWFKAVTVTADFNQLQQIIQLPYVKKADFVNTLTASMPDKIIEMKPHKTPLNALVFNYGYSYFQDLFINSIKLHQVGLTGKGVMIAIFDSGFEWHHRAFDSANIIATYDFVNNDSSADFEDCPSAPPTIQQRYHGTLTFGVIGGYVPDTLIGIAPQADFILAKTEITCGGKEIKIEEDNWIAAAQWADSIGADIISSSLGYTKFQDSGSYSFSDLDGNTALITIAADIAASKNILVVNAVGNERGSSWNHLVAPADGDSVLAVGAVNPDSTLAPFSSPGPTADGRIKPDIVTLGVNVFSAFYLGGYAYVSGTSFSTPLVAGAAALVMENNPALTAHEIINRIHNSGDRSDNPDNNYGYGLFNAMAVADIIKFNLPQVIKVDYRSQITIDITTSGLTDSIPKLSAIGLPSWISFIDHNNGTGTLEITPSPSSLPSLKFGLIADIGYFADTSYYTLEIFGLSNNLIYAGPNPFRDVVNIYVKSAAGEIKSVSIFNTAGEKVWEKVNISPNSADIGGIIRWYGCNQKGEVVSAGVYVCVVQTYRQKYRLKLLKTN